MVARQCGQMVAHGVALLEPAYLLTPIASSFLRSLDSVDREQRRSQFGGLSDWGAVSVTAGYGSPPVSITLTEISERPSA
jgi:hypothetical protein